MGQKEHEADRWGGGDSTVASGPLVAHDRIFANVNNLELLTKLGE